MQLVFVHGVAVRREPDASEYDAVVADRHRAFSDWCMPGTQVAFHDPYWGIHGARPSHDYASIPTDSGVALGIGGLGSSLPANRPEGSLDGDALIAAARADFGGTLNTLSLELVGRGDAASIDSALRIGDYAAMLDGDADGVAKIEPPAWVADSSLRRDEDFLSRLAEETGADAATALGLGDVIRTAGRRLLGTAANLVDGPAKQLVRRMTPHIARFLGDVFVYLRQDDARVRIRQEVMSALTAAARASAEGGGPLVVLGHSMGGIILFDLLTDPEAVAELEQRLGGSFSIDLLLTVGTQIGLFEELGLFVSSAPDRAAAGPPSAKRWWHVYNVMDVLSFGVRGVVGGSLEFGVDTNANVIDAHTAYFRSPVFHRRLRRRLRENGLLA